MEYSKKDLAKKFGMSANTVTSTLAICGFDTRLTTYRGELIETRFALAHQMLNEGKTQKEVKDYIASLELQEFTQEYEASEEEFDTNQFADSQARAIQNTISIEAAQMASDFIEQGVSDVIDYLPAMLMEAFNRQLNGEEVKASFQAMRSKNKKKSSGAAFLCQKMQKAQAVQMPQKNLMQGTQQEQKHLPQASPENSQGD